MLNLILSIFIGIILSLFYIYLFPEKKVKHYKKRSKKKRKNKSLHKDVQIAIEEQEDKNDEDDNTEEKVSIQDSGNINNILKHY